MKEDDRVRYDGYGAYLEFATPSTFGLSARLWHETAGETGRFGLIALIHREYAVECPGAIPFRVVPRGQPVTVLLGIYSQRGSFTWSERLAYGTLEARVGDTLMLDCGLDIDPPRDGPERAAFVEALPFRDVPHYAPR